SAWRHLEIAFLRPDPMRGTFYEAVWRSLDRITGPATLPVLALIVIALALILRPLFSFLKPRKSN
ncbi:MAG: hypothetical protein ACQKBY_07860, partial [Verrucomicrobiales bacterium]